MIRKHAPSATVPVPSTSRAGSFFVTYRNGSVSSPANKTPLGYHGFSKDYSRKIEPFRTEADASRATQNRPLPRTPPHPALLHEYRRLFRAPCYTILALLVEAGPELASRFLTKFTRMVQLCSRIPSSSVSVFLAANVRRCCCAAKLRNKTIEMNQNHAPIIGQKLGTQPIHHDRTPRDLRHGHAGKRDKPSRCPAIVAQQSPWTLRWFRFAAEGARFLFLSSRPNPIPPMRILGFQPAQTGSRSVGLD